MIDFILMINKSDDNYLDKNLEPGITVQGVIKDDCSIENPVLNVDLFNNGLAFERIAELSACENSVECSILITVSGNQNSTLHLAAKLNSDLNC